MPKKKKSEKFFFKRKIFAMSIGQKNVLNDRLCLYICY